jgi:epoxyqueuosine reductase
MGEWLFGCDLCQEVCPLNVRARETDVPAFVRPIAGSRVLLRELLHMRDHESFVDRFAGSPLMRPGWRLMLRNAAIVAANTGAVDLLPDLRASLTIDDAVIREHVNWAIDRLSDK